MLKILSKEKYDKSSDNKKFFNKDIQYLLTKGFFTEKFSDLKQNAETIATSYPNRHKNTTLNNIIAKSNKDIFSGNIDYYYPKTNRTRNNAFHNNSHKKFKTYEVKSPKQTINSYSLKYPNKFQRTQSSFPKKKKSINKLLSFNDIDKFEKSLTQKENKFKSVIKNKREKTLLLNQEIQNNIGNLETNVDEMFSELEKVKSDLNHENKEMIKDFYENQKNWIIKKRIETDKYTINQEINELRNKIEQLDNETNKNKQLAENLSEEIINKKQAFKNLPVLIDALMEENKNLMQSKINIDAKIKKINGEMLKFNFNKEKIVGNFLKAENLYKKMKIIK